MNQTGKKISLTCFSILSNFSLGVSILSSGGFLTIASVNLGGLYNFPVCTVGFSSTNR